MLISIYKLKFDGIIDVEFEKVKGHSNNTYNDKADELAKRALESNARVPITGENWFLIPHVKLEEINNIIGIIKQENENINITKEEKSNATIYRLILKKKKTTVTVYKSGMKKLLVQGAAESVPFQIFITYVNEYLRLNAEQVFSSAYRKNIDPKVIDDGIQDICPALPNNYPDSIRRLIRQAIINLNYFVEAEDYSQYAFPALRALEGHIKYLCTKANIQIDTKESFSIFFKEKDKYILQPIYSSTIKSGLKATLEEYYNYYHAQRHTLFHFGDIIGETDSTRIVESKKEADEVIKNCVSLIYNEA